jgi:hypothetical protein
MKNLQEMIRERHRMLNAHENGGRRLNGEEHERASRQVVNFQRKLEAMKASNTDVSFTLLCQRLPSNLEVK